MKLSICIPTYNRAWFLDRAVRSVVDQVEDGLDFDILISDNASTDGTTEIGMKWSAAYPWIHYKRHAENRMIDGNLTYLFSSATGDYIVLLMDDDMHLPGTLRRIRDEVVRHHPAACYLNHYAFRAETPEKPLWLAHKPKDQIFKNGRDFVAACGLGFGSAIIVNRVNAQELLPEALYVAGRSPHNLHLILATMIAMKKNGPYLFLASILVPAYSPDVPSYDIMDHGYISTSLIYNELYRLGFIDSDFLNRWRYKLITHNLCRYALKKRLYSEFDPAAIEALGNALEWHWAYSFLFVPLAKFLPSFIIKPIYFILKKIYQTFSKLIASKRSRHFTDQKTMKISHSS